MHAHLMNLLIVLIDLLIEHHLHLDLTLNARDEHLVLQEPTEEQISKGQTGRYRQDNPQIVRDHDLNCQDDFHGPMEYKEQ